MAQLTWEAMNPIDTSKYLDAIQKAQAQSVAGVEQIGNAYKGYYDNLSKQNTNDMLTALNQAQNPEQLAAAQANIAAMQQRWGSGYDMDAVRTAMDERPAVLNERASQALKYQQEKALYEAYPQINAAAAKFAAGRKGVTPEMAEQLNALAALGIDTSGYINSLATSANTDFTTERTYTTGVENRKEDLEIAEKARKQTQENWQDEFDFKTDESNWNRGKQISDSYPKGNTLSFQDGKWVTTTNPGISHLEAYGALSGVVNKMVGAESSWKADAKNPRSTATGGGQFIESTWLDVISRNRPDLVKGKSREQILAMRNDLKLSVEMTEAYARENIASLKKANLPVTEGTIYLSKFAGPGGARSLLRADPNASAESVLGSAVAKANPTIVKGKTVGEVIRWADNKMRGQGSSSSTSTAAAASNAIQIPQSIGAKAVSNYSTAITELNNKFNLQTTQDQSKTGMGTKGQTIDSWLISQSTKDREGSTLITDYASKVAKLARNNAKLSNLPMDDQLKVLDAAHAWALTPGGVITDKHLNARITNLATSLIDGKKNELAQGKKNIFETQYQAFVKELNAAGMGAVSRDAFRLLVSPETASKPTKTTPETPPASKPSKPAAKASPASTAAAAATAAVATAAKPKPAAKPESKKAAETPKQDFKPKPAPRPYDNLVLNFPDAKTKAEFAKKVEDAEKKSAQAREAAEAAKKAQKLREEAAKKRKEADILAKRAREEAARKAEEELRRAKYRKQREARLHPAPSDEWLKSAKERLNQNR